jgi:hypothetical protein
VIEGGDESGSGLSLHQGLHLRIVISHDRLCIEIVGMAFELVVEELTAESNAGSVDSIARQSKILYFVIIE